MRQNGSSLQAIADELNRIEDEAVNLAGRPRPVQRRNASTVKRELDRNRQRQDAIILRQPMRWHMRDASGLSAIRHSSPGYSMAIRLLKE